MALGKAFGGKEIEGVGKVHGADCCRLQLLQALLHSAGAAGSAAPGIVAIARGADARRSRGRRRRSAHRQFLPWAPR